MFSERYKSYSSLKTTRQCYFVESIQRKKTLEKLEIKNISEKSKV